jgi:hypothetical protein
VAEKTGPLIAFIVINLAQHVNQGAVRPDFLPRLDGLGVPFFDFRDAFRLFKIRGRLAFAPGIVPS